MAFMSVGRCQRSNVGSTSVDYPRRETLHVPSYRRTTSAIVVSVLLLMSSSACPTATAFSATSTSVTGASGGIPPSSSTTSPIVTSSSSCPSYTKPVCVYHQVMVPTSMEGPPRQCISVEDLTPIIQQLLDTSGLQYGAVTVVSRHTTTAITINERESRLAQDMASYFLKLVPPDERSVAAASVTESTSRSIDGPAQPSDGVGLSTGIRYKHNDIHLRPDSAEEAQRCRDNGWDIDDPNILQAWRDQEPINAHSHLLSMLLGSTETIPVVDGKMIIGQWQSILLVDLDGPRDRTVGIHLMGYQ